MAMGLDTITIVPTGLSDEVHLVTLEREEISLPLTCPMRTDDLPGARCVIRGGPWISASIHAASIWVTHRQLLLERLGCASCENGTQPTLGPLAHMRGPISLEEHQISSRYSGYSWRRRPGIA